MHEVRLQFDEEEVLLYLTRKGLNPWVMKKEQKQQHIHGSHFEEVQPVEEWVVLFNKRIRPMYEVFDLIIKKELLK